MPDTPELTVTLGAEPAAVLRRLAVILGTEPADALGHAIGLLDQAVRDRSQGRRWLSEKDRRVEQIVLPGGTGG